jgi:glycosyltransferase involved in cell wall biosynthesis
MLDIVAKISYKHTACLIPVSAGYTKTLTEKYNIPAEKITVIEQGVDVHKFKRTVEIGSGTGGKKVVMYSGALTEGYDFESLIQAAKMLQTEPLSFVIRGTGALFKDILRSVNDNKVLNLDLSNDILSIKELVTLMSTADIFVLPMKSGGVIDEGLPTKILEYQALGKPIICISAGEPGRYILRCKSGLVVGPKQVEALALTIKNLAKDEALTRELGDNGYKHVMNNLTFDKLGERLLNVINKSLGQPE